MIVSTLRSLALRCPLCGKLELHQISLFELTGYSPVKVNCRCGFTKALVLTKNYKKISIQIPCLLCEEQHLFKYTCRDFVEKPILILRCIETGQELGYVGTDETINRLMKQKQNDLESIFNNFGFDDYFTNPQVMMEVLNHMHQVADESNLFCSCGNSQIDMDVFPEKLELHCPVCRSLHVIYAETYEDLRVVKQARIITLTEKGFTSLDSSKTNPSLHS